METCNPCVGSHSEWHSLCADANPINSTSRKRYHFFILILIPVIYSAALRLSRDLSVVEKSAYPVKTAL